MWRGCCWFQGWVLDSQCVPRDPWLSLSTTAQNFAVFPPPVSKVRYFFSLWGVFFVRGSRKMSPNAQIGWATISREDLQRKKKNENWEQHREKKTRNFGHTTLRASCPSAPHPSGPTFCWVWPTAPPNPPTSGPQFLPVTKNPISFAF